VSSWAESGGSASRLPAAHAVGKETESRQSDRDSIRASPARRRMPLNMCASAAGTDIAMIWGMMHHIFANGWEDKEFIRQRVYGMEDPRRSRQVESGRS
jgi:hypothetical protein